MNTFPRSGEEFDLQPDPRILPMLGEINLVQWRCLAEFVDNSIDGFILARRSGQSIATPEVHITLPTADVPTARITVRDNGPGMDPATLERAVRAGWTGNDPIHNLGMFGMGFNIATARLGSVTRAWTTRRGDAEWCGLEIDFEKLMQQKHFKTPKLTRPKVDPHEHGTEISVERLKPEQRQWFSRAGNRSKVTKELGRTYSAMLRPNGVPISVHVMLNGSWVAGRNHCVWGGEGNPDRVVMTARYGSVSVYQNVDVRLADRPFCTRCWQWLPADEEMCPACGLASDVVPRQRRVHGWLGVQRYLSKTDFGIDFLRHGRKIEIASKDLFYWNDGETLEPEYPIDDPRNRGRIVGEIHVDHCRVMYTKDRFDRNDPAWEEMVRIVRGDGPLRPDKASELGIGQNTSPLFLLFQAFRRSSPKPKVAGCYAKLLVVPENERAEEMAKRFYAGEAEYQMDTKWFELVAEEDRKLLVSSKAGSGSPEQHILEGFGTEGQREAPSGPPPVTDHTVPVLRIPVPSLTREYFDEESSLRWDVKAFRLQSSDPLLEAASRPWLLRRNPDGVYEFLVDVDHAIFQSATMTPLDGLLAELAHTAMDFLRANSSSATFASTLAALRDRYAETSKLDPIVLSGDAGLTLTGIARSLGKNIGSEDSRTLFNELSPAEQEWILQKMAARGVRNPDEVISGGRFLEYGPRKTLLKFVEKHPELFFDGRYWDTAYSTLDYGRAAATEEAQAQVLHYHLGLLTDAIWLDEQDPTDLADASRSRLLRAALALELLSADDGSEREV